MTRKETYQWYKAHGVCVRCHQADAVSGKTLCPACADAEKRRNRRYAERKKAANPKAYLAALSDKNRKRYEQKKQAGICIACRRKAAPGRSRCSIHLAKERVREKATREWKDPTECRYCHEPRVEGYAYCEQHLERARKIGRQIGKLPVPDDHPWKQNTGKKSKIAL